MSDETFDVAAFAAQATGTTGISDDAGLDQVVPDRLADDLDAYADHAQQRDQHLADDDDPDDAEQVDPTGLKNKSVPLGALQEERMRRKEAQDQAAQLQQQLGQLQAYQQQVQAFLAQQQQAQLEAQIPAFEDDPEGHLNAVKAQMANELGQMRNQLETQQRVAQFSAQLQQEVTAMAPAISSAEDEMRAEVGSHYDEACEHVNRLAMERMRQLHPYADPQALEQTKNAAVIQFMRDHVSRGESPARTIWNLAQQLGFVPSGQRVPGQERKAPPTSLSTVPAAGRAPDQRGRLTAKDIASMPQDEFDQMFESMRRGATQMPV
ncbi:hypothetical protein [Pseudomonas sp. NPDC012596]|uniref:hypothetical protein n=1 Tax=Pseudomonas sp. NPDC012596 TaxID=3364419 RepID=UPI0036ABD554